MKTQIKVLFYLRKSKVNAQGLMPIFQRITINGQRFEVSIGYYVDEAKWSSEAAKIKGNSEEACSINSYLDLIKSKILDIQMKLIHKNQEVNIENFKSKLFGLEEKQCMLVPIFQDHNSKMEELVGKEYTLDTLLLPIFNMSNS